MKEFENLEYFFSAYFHQDCLLDESTYTDTVRLFIENEKPELVKNVERELSRLISQELLEENLIQILIDFGCEYDPSIDGNSAKEWVVQVYKFVIAQQ